MHTILIGGPEAEALTAPTDFAATDSNAGRAKVANEDFKKSRLFMGIFKVPNSGKNAMFEEWPRLSTHIAR